MEHPRPGSMISTPVFGNELFVAHLKGVTIGKTGNGKLFTVYSQVSLARSPRISAHAYAF